MSEILKFRQVNASSAVDMVGLKFDHDRLLMYYQTAFKMAAALCMAAKMAGRYEGVQPRLYRDFIHLAGLPGRPSTHREYRRSRHMPNFDKWEVGGKRNLVFMRFERNDGNELIIWMHYSDAFKLYTRFRHSAREAKAWAGDDGRVWTTRAHLTTAEHNDKFLYVA